MMVEYKQIEKKEYNPANLLIEGDPRVVHFMTACTFNLSIKLNQLLNSNVNHVLLFIYYLEMPFVILDGNEIGNVLEISFNVES